MADTEFGHVPDSLYTRDEDRSDLMLGRLILWTLIAAIAVWLFLAAPDWTALHWAAGTGNTIAALYLACKD